MPFDPVPQQIQDYLDTLVPARPAEMHAMEQYAAEVHFPIIGPASGQMCYVIARIANARRIFEMGSGYGYSTAWFARAVRENGGGEVHHVVWDEGLSQKARAHLGALGYDDLIHYQVSEAIQALTQASGSFDLIFNDIDKQAYPESLPIIYDKLRPGGVLIIDNMLLHGRIFDQDDQAAGTVGVREFTRLITTDPNWQVTLLPIRDGLIVARKN